MADQPLPLAVAPAVDESETDPRTLPWVFETGEDIDPDSGRRMPWRTVWAIDPTWADDRWPLADLTDEAPDDVGTLMAAAPALLAAVRALAEAEESYRLGDEDGASLIDTALRQARVAIAKAESK